MGGPASLFCHRLSLPYRMGASHSCDDNPVLQPVRLTVVIPSKGNKVLKNKFTKDVPTVDMTIERYFQRNVLALLPADESGKLLSVGIVMRGGDPSDEVEVDSLRDECFLYVQMGLAGKGHLLR